MVQTTMESILAECRRIVNTSTRRWCWSGCAALGACQFVERNEGRSEVILSIAEPLRILSYIACPVQYFYTMALITPLQHAPAVLSQLLLLSSTYNLAHLQSLVKHAMHRALPMQLLWVSTVCQRYVIVGAYKSGTTSSLCFPFFV